MYHKTYRDQITIPKPISEIYSDSTVTRFILYEDDHKRLHYLDLISIFVHFIIYFILLGFLNISDIGLGIVI